jgi:glycosyltransferase involved in cell wall biosynthesis
MVFWHQDIYSEAIGVAARRRIPVLGGLLARVADRVERRIARRSVAIVAISPTFLERLAEWGVADKTTIVPNWAPIDELAVHPADNPWRQRQGLTDAPVVLYSGTLGLKHDPSILAELASGLRDSHPDARVVVISEGKGRDFLEQHKAHGGVGADNLVLLDFQPYEELPEVMASADVLVAILEPDASKFSVPSKVLTYLCSSRAILGVLPPDNSVAEILSSQQAGVVVAPSDRARVAQQAAELLDDPGRRTAMGQAGRAYAERTFSPETAADQFLGVFGDLVVPPLGAGMAR